MSKLGNWYSEQRKLTAFLREHKDEYDPVAIRYTVILAVVASVMALTAFTLGYADASGELFLKGVAASALGVQIVGFFLLTIIGGRALDRKIRQLKQKYNYNTNH